MGEDVFGIITDFTNDTLNELIRQCVDEYALIPWQDTSCGYGCSDHASWYDGHVALHDRITPDRIQEFREVAKMMAEHYNPFCSKFTSYIDGVTAHLIKYHYKL